MQYRKDIKGHRYQFDSLNEVARYLEDTRPTWPHKQSRTNPQERSWDLNAGYDGAWDMIRNGWIEGAQRAQRALKAFTPATPQPTIRNDFYGHAPNVPRYCAGAPDSMIRHAPVATMGGGRVLTLVVPVWVSASVDAQCMSNFGLGVAQYVNQLETDGIRVELYANLNGLTEAGERLSYTIRLKRPDAPLDMAIIAFGIGHPAMFRRIGFALYERSAAKPDKYYAFPLPMVAADAINLPAGTVILEGINSANSVARTPEDALAYIGERIDEIIKAGA